MTLSTLVGFEEYTDPQEFHDWINRELLNAPDAQYEVYGPEGSELGIWQNTICNQPGQGLSAWAITHHNDGDVAVYIYAGDDGDDPALRVYTDLDTAYGYRDEEGRGCTDLHRTFILRIIREFAEPRGLTVWWQNEYTGEWHKDMAGLADFR